MDRRELLLYLMQIERTARRPGQTNGIPKVRPENAPERPQDGPEQVTLDDFSPEEIERHEKLLGPNWLEDTNDALREEHEAEQEELGQDDEWSLLSDADLALDDLLEAGAEDPELLEYDPGDIAAAMERRIMGANDYGFVPPEYYGEDYE